jgi:hypothetical protein
MRRPTGAAASALLPDRDFDSVLIDGFLAISQELVATGDLAPQRCKLGLAMFGLGCEVALAFSITLSVGRHAALPSLQAGAR